MKYTVESRKFDETMVHTVYEDGIAVADFTRREDAERECDAYNAAAARLLG